MDRELWRLGFVGSLTGTAIRLTHPDQGTIGLINLAQMCHRVPGEEWGPVASQFLKTVLEMDESRAEPGILSSATGLPCDCIRRTLVIDAEVALRPFTKGIVAVVVLDFPSSARSVRVHDLVASGISLDEALSVGWDDVRR